MPRAIRISAPSLCSKTAVNLLDDGIDVSIRIGTLEDSSLVARRVSRQQNIISGSPRQLAGRRIESIGDLTACDDTIGSRAELGADLFCTFAG